MSPGNELDRLGAATLDWLVRSALLCTAATLLVAVLRRRSATAAHAAWIATLCGVALLPLAMWWLPSWSAPLPSGCFAWLRVTNRAPSATARETAPERELATGMLTTETAPSAAIVEPADKSRRAATSDALAAASIDPALAPADLCVVSLEATTASGPRNRDDAASIATHSVSGSPASAAATPASENAARDRVTLLSGNSSWVRVALLCWGVVASWLMIRLVVHGWRLTWFLRACRPAPSELECLARAHAGELGVRGACSLRLAPAGTMPATGWLGRWWVALPEDALEWDAETRRAVLTHELGHVARRDAWSDLLAQGLCCVAWFHPWLWYVRRSLRRLRELACDEWVVATGQVSAREYARVLLEVAARCRRSLSPASAMAAGELETRLGRLVSRRRPTVWGAAPRLLVQGGCLVVAAALATVGPVSAWQRPAAAPTQPTEPKATTSPRSGLGPAFDREWRTAEPAPQHGPRLRLSGVVVDERGEPLSGATLAVRASTGGSQHVMGLRHNGDLLAQIRSDEEGRFQLDEVKIPPRLQSTIASLRTGAGGAELIAWAPGRGLSWTKIHTLQDDSPARIELHPEAEARGIVLDASGKPVVGAVVQCSGVVGDGGDPWVQSPQDLNLTLSQLELVARTDSEGRFSLSHVPRGRLAIVHVGGGEGFAAIQLDTSDAEHPLPPLPPAAREWSQGFPEFEKSRSPVEFHVKSLGGQIAVRLLDDEGRPFLGGAEVIDLQGHYAQRGDFDEEGVLRVEVRPGKYRLVVGADPLAPRLGFGQLAVEATTSGGAPIEYRLPATMWQEGRVVDSQGRGVAGVHILYSSGDPTIDDNIPRRLVSQAVCDVEGRFRIPVARGRGMLIIRHEVDGYFAPTFTNTARQPRPLRIEVADGPPAPVELRIGRGLVLKGVVTHSGRPVKGAELIAETIDSPFIRHTTMTDEEGRYELAGLPPHISVFVRAASDVGAARQHIEPASSLDWTRDRIVDLELELGPAVTLTGLATRRGAPAPGVRLQLTRTVFTGRTEMTPGPTVTTDAEGRYRVPGLFPGDQYQFTVTTDSGERAPDWPYQGGYVKSVSQGERRAELELDELKLVGASQTLVGVVVDPDGNPVSKAHVSAQLANGRHIQRNFQGPPPWTETDTSGRFQLVGLPDDDLQLMVYLANPQGGSIRYAAFVTPRRGQSDLRILLDPRLHTEIEDLDAEK